MNAPLLNFSTAFRCIRDEVSADEWQARLDLAACYRLVDAYDMTDLMYNLELACRAQVDVMAARTELKMPAAAVLDKTADLYQPCTRRPYGVLEWHAMLRLLGAQQKSSGFPPYWN